MAGKLQGFAAERETGGINMTSFDWIPETLLSIEMFCRKNNLHRCVQALSDAAVLVESEMRELEAANRAPHSTGANPVEDHRARRGEIVPLFGSGENGSKSTPDDS